MMASKKSLLASGVALLASVALLAGTTFAWFTDSVVNTGNKIQAGNLSIGAYAYDLAEDGEGGFEIEGVNGGNPFKFETEGQNLKTDKNPIISDTLFEPGKSNAKLLKVENEGTLAAKIKVDFTVEDGGLTEALWFDFVKVENGEVKGNFTRRPMNTLETFAENLELPLLENGDNVQFILIYGMDENAGNAFKEKFFTADVRILATQHTYEEDGFGNDQYDKGATARVEDAAGFIAALERAFDGEEGLVIELTKDINMSGMSLPESAVMTNVVIDGNGYAIRSMTGSNLYYYAGSDNLVRNIRFVDCDLRYGVLGYGLADVSASSTDKLTAENVSVENSTTYGGGLLSYTGQGQVVFRGCTIDEDSVIASFSSGMYTGGFIGNGQRFVIEDCEMNGTVVGTNGGAGGFVGQGGYADAVIRNSRMNGTIRMYYQNGNVYVIAGSAGTVENVTYDNAQVRYVGSNTRVTAVGGTPLVGDIDMQEIPAVLTDDSIARENGKIVLKTGASEDVVTYKVSHLVYYSTRNADGTVSPNYSNTVHSDTVAAANVTDGVLAGAMRGVYQVVDALDAPDRTVFATTDATNAGKYVDGYYYLDARTQPDGSYSYLFGPEGSANVSLKVEAFDAEGILIGVVNQSYTFSDQ